MFGYAAATSVVFCLSRVYTNIFVYFKKNTFDKKALAFDLTITFFVLAIAYFFFPTRYFKMSLFGAAFLGLFTFALFARMIEDTLDNK